MNAGEVDSTPYPSHQEPIPKGAHTKLPCSKTHINLKKSTFESVNATRHIFITLAALIFLGHSFVPHNHEDTHPAEALHQHDDHHHGIGDLLVCFFHVDHESEDFNNFFSPDLNPSIATNGYAVIPQTYFVQKPLAFESVVPSAPTLGTHFLRGPPLA
jgi:zinc transporter ZupT